ncbi:cytochrome P450 [Lasiosphaeria miniovina]|uniref:Cytochrome P450 n=1 Tax=Lasiosphaeria miniovina TaxID=1954250 RepID=A0AA40EF18_9PEZI|nr:cytochrome P450 [Lasiosphaeria miniovina]KAK0732903.1 cytochrome P450 [Lasiosphaeria miniovina]
MSPEYKLKGVSSLALQPGDKQEVEVEGLDAKVLLLNAGGKVQAIGPNTCFNSKTGDIEDAPGLDALPVFKTTERDGAVYITGDADTIKSGRRKPNFKCTATGGDKVVVVGGGSGALGVVEGLREKGFKGAITVITSEGYLPIDRPKLSKALLTDLAKLQWRDEEWFKSGSVDIVQDEVTGVDFGTKTVATKSGGKFAYGKLVLSTGGTPRLLPLQGFKVLGNVFTLRNVHDVKKIVEAIGEKGKKIVIIGSSFIGMEIAVATSSGNDVTVVGMEKAPLERVLGEQVGNIVKKGVEAKGVKFYLSAGVEKAEPSASDPSSVGFVHLKDGTKLEADIVILGVGVAPATEYLKDNSVVRLEGDGSLKTDESFSVVGLKDVYAIGDIATYPYHGPGGGGKYVRIEHWNVAQNAGRTVASHIVNPGLEPQFFTPVFWSALGAQMRYCGNTMASGWDDVVLQGTPDQGKWAAFYTKGETVVAMASVGMDPVMAQSAQLMQLGRMPSKTELKNGLDVLSLGPPQLAAISNVWQAHHARHGRMLQLGKTLHQKYGAAVRVGPNEVWFDSSEAFKSIYSVGNGFDKSGFYLATSLSKPTIDWRLKLHFPDTLDFLSEFDVKRYRLQRRLIRPLYQTSNLQKFEPAIDDVIDKVISKLRSLKGAEVDLKEWMHIIAVECLGAVVLSWSPGYIRNGSDAGTSAQGYLGWKRKSVFGLFPTITTAAFFSRSLGRSFSNLWGVTFKTPKNFKPFFTPVYQKTSKRVAAALRLDPRQQTKDAGRKDLLADLIQLHKDRPEFTETYLRRLAMTNFGAGHETMCSALTSAMAMIGSHRDAQQKAAAEVRDAVPGPTSYGTAVRLRYTQASIREAQRLYPVIGMSLSRTVPSGGMEAHGCYFPSGTTVGCNPVALHRNAEIFGPDATEYNPSRWLEDRQDRDVDQVRQMERYNLIWGGGSRACPGRHLAEMVLFKAVPSLLKAFDIRVTHMPPDDDIQYYFMAMITGVKARFLPIGPAAEI